MQLLVLSIMVCFKNRVHGEKVGQKSKPVVTQTMLGGLTVYPPVANFLRCIRAKNYENWLAVNKVIVKISRLTFLAHSVAYEQRHCQGHNHNFWIMNWSHIVTGTCHHHHVFLLLLLLLVEAVYKNV